MITQEMKPIAYLASEIPALSATFVYEEILGLERRGHKVIPVSVRRPDVAAAQQAELAARTHCLYGGPMRELFFALLKCAGNQPLALVKALSLLLSDLVRSNPFRIRTWKLAYQFLAGCRLAAIMEKDNCTHLHIHFAHVPTQIGMYASIISGLPFTFVAHANDIFERAFLLKQKTARAKQLITISEYNKSYLVEQGLPENKISLVRCGVSFDSARKEGNFERETVYRIGTLGRLVEKKGIDTLIKTVALLRTQPYSIELDICGDGPLRESLEDLVREYELEKHVKFRGSVSHSGVAGWLRSLHLFVLACKTDTNGDKDGIPVVLMEAMSQSIPVLSTRISGIPELVIHERTGLLAAPDDPGDLAKQITRLLENPDLRQRYTTDALKHVNSEFSMETNLDRLEKWILSP